MKKSLLLIIFVLTSCSTVNFQPVLIDDHYILRDEKTDEVTATLIYKGLLEKTYIEKHDVPPKITLDSMISGVGGISGNVAISESSREFCGREATHEYWNYAPADCFTSLFICLVMPEVPTKEFHVIDYGLYVSAEDLCED